MRRVLLFVLVSLISVATSAQTILVVGDSLSAAYNMQQDQGWVNLLQERLNKEYRDAGYRVVNSSISGDTSAGGLSRLPQALKAHQPAIVIIGLGANDGLRALSTRSLKRNLGRMIELALDQDAKVLLAGMHLPPNYGERFTEKFHQVYQDLSKDHDITLIPFLLDKVGGVNEMIQADGMHPNAEAQPVILENVWPHLNKLLDPH